MMEKEIHYADDLEESVGEMLTKLNIRFTHESTGAALDFYLCDYDIHIEVKQFYSERSIRQLEGHGNVILIQGRRSIAFLEALFKK